MFHVFQRLKQLFPAIIRRWTWINSHRGVHLIHVLVCNKCPRWRHRLNLRSQKDLRRSFSFDYTQASYASKRSDEVQCVLSKFQRLRLFMSARFLWGAHCVQYKPSTHTTKSTRRGINNAKYANIQSTFHLWLSPNYSSDQWKDWMNAMIYISTLMSAFGPKLEQFHQTIIYQDVWVLTMS